MSRVRHFRYAPHKPHAGGGLRSAGVPIAGHHAVYSSLVEIKPRKKARRIEDGIQRAMVELLAVYRNQGRLIYFAVPNGERRDAITGAILKRQGVIPGAPDLVILPLNRVPILVEVKVPGGKQSPAQKDFEARATDLGHVYKVVRDVNELDALLKAHFR